MWRLLALVAFSRNAVPLARGSQWSSLATDNSKLALTEATYLFANTQAVSPHETRTLVCVGPDLEIGYTGYSAQRN